MNINFSPLDTSSELLSGNPIKAGDLDFYMLLRRQSGDSKLFFNQRRSLLFDAGTMGALRQQLIDTVGQDVARGVLMRAGYAQGYQDAEMLGDTFSWETDSEWLLAGLTLRMLEGIVHVESRTVEFNRNTGEFYMNGLWRNSYEAEEHLKRNDPGEHPVCWMLAGYASGYASRFFGRELLAIETECVGKGDEQCLWEIKPVKEWGAKAAPYAEALRQVEARGSQAEKKSAEKALQESQALYQSSLNGMPQNVYRIDRGGHIIFGNKTYLNTLGMSLAECLGKTAYDFFPKEQADKFTADDNRVMESGEPLDVVEGHKVPATGEMTYVHTIKVPVHDAEGNVAGVQGIFWDVTERVQAEQLLTKRAIELETVSKVSTATSTILDVQELLQTVCDLTKENFSLYHAHIYRLNETGNTLNLAAGAGEKGRKLAGQKWSIPFAKEDSVVARTARTRQGIISNDVRAETGFLPNPLLPDTRSELAVPMVVGDRLLGVLDVQADAVDHFTAEDIRIQTTLAAQIAVALENAQRYENSQKVTRRMAQLNKMSALLGQSTTIQDALDSTAERVDAILESDRGSVTLLNDAGDTLEVFALQGRQGAIPTGTQLPVKGTALGRCVTENKIQVIPDTLNSAYLDTRRLASQGIHSTIVAPLTVGGKVIGTLNGGSTEYDAFDQDSQAILLQMASLLATTIESHRLLEAARYRALREQALRQVTARIRGSADVDTVMRTAALEVGKALGRQAFVYLGQEEKGKNTQPSAAEKETRND